MKNSIMSLVIVLALSTISFAQTPFPYSRSSRTSTGTTFYNRSGAVVGRSFNTRSGNTYYRSNGRSYGRTFTTRSGNQYFRPTYNRYGRR